MLVNYWWNDARRAGSAFDAMLHAVLALRDLPPEQRAVWHTLFEHYVFQPADDAMAHLPREQRGMLGPPSPERDAAIRAILARAFSRYLKRRCLVAARAASARSMQRDGGIQRHGNDSRFT